MSMESAVKAMTAIQEAKSAPAAKVEETPTTQAAQETKVNETNGLQTSATEVSKTPGEVESAPIEAKVEEEKSPSPAENPALSSKFAALAKKERAIVKKQEEVKLRDADVAKREATLAEREAKILESEKMFNEDVFKALELRGYSYQKLTDMLLSGEKVAKKEPEDPATLAQRKIEEFEKRMAEKEAARIAAEEKAKKDAEEQEAARIEAAWKKYSEEVNAYVKEHSAEYELIELFGQHQLILDTTDEYYKQHQRVLSIKEASDMVEEYLVNEAKKAAQAKKLSSVVAKPETPTKKESASSEKVTKTLNNNMTPTTSSTLPAATEADRMKRALAALQAAK